MKLALEEACLGGYHVILTYVLLLSYFVYIYVLEIRKKKKQTAIAVYEFTSVLFVLCNMKMVAVKGNHPQNSSTLCCTNYRDTYSATLNTCQLQFCITMELLFVIQ